MVESTEFGSAPLNQDPSATADSQWSPRRDEVDGRYNLEPFTHVHSPKESIDYINLNAIDFGRFKEGPSPEAVAARKELARDLDVSLRTHGFFFIVNHGIKESTIDRINSIAQAVHSMPESEKVNYRSGGLTSDEDVNSDGAERGPSFKPRGYWSMADGVRDNISFYNYSHLVHDEAIQNQNHPPVASDYMNEVLNYFRFIHHSVLKRLTILCDIILELPEGTLYERYFRVINGDIKESGGGFGRLMVYYGQSEEENRKTGNTWLRGHSDSDGFTFIASQPMVSLQIRDYESGEWGYVKHVPGALVVNIGDAVEFLTGGYWRSTIHRVVNPPPSQSGHRRQAIIYFCKPSWDTIIDPEELRSPYLERLGIHSQPQWERIDYGKWDLEKGRLFGQSKVNKNSGDAPQAVQLYGRLSERWVPTIGLEKLST